MPDDRLMALEDRPCPRRAHGGGAERSGARAGRPHRPARAPDGVPRGADRGDRGGGRGGAGGRPAAAALVGAALTNGRFPGCTAFVRPMYIAGTFHVPPTGLTRAPARAGRGPRRPFRRGPGRSGLLHEGADDRGQDAAAGDAADELGDELAPVDAAGRRCRRRRRRWGRCPAPPRSAPSSDPPATPPIAPEMSFGRSAMPAALTMLPAKPPPTAPAIACTMIATSPSASHHPPRRPLGGLEE